MNLEFSRNNVKILLYSVEPDFLTLHENFWMKFLACIQRNWFNVYTLEFMYLFKIDFKTELQIPSRYEFPL